MPMINASHVRFDWPKSVSGKFVTVLSQSVMQDVTWLHQLEPQIRKKTQGRQGREMKSRREQRRGREQTIEAMV